MRNDLKFAVRQLLKNPGFTAVAVLTLALGIGANAALFSALDALLFRPLAAKDPSRLVYVSTGRDFSFPLYERMRASMSSFEGELAASQIRAPLREVLVPGWDRAEEIPTQGVTGNFFNILGVPPLLGRTFVEDDDRKGSAEPVVVISHGVWVQRFGADPAVLGRQVRLDNVPVTIIGVMPPDFVGFESDVRPGLWWPLQLVSRIETRQSPLGEGVSWLVLFGRLQHGVTREQAQAEASVFFRREIEEELAKDPTRSPAERERLLKQELRVLSGRAGFVGARGEFQQPLTILMAAVAVVLLIACTNIAGLLLARGTTRQREFAMRTALGAGRGRIVRQLFIESFVLVASGGVSGVIVAQAGTRFLSHFIAQSNTPLAVAPDERTVFFTFGVTVVVGILCGLIPAWRSSRTDLVTAIKSQTNVTERSSRSWLQPTLVIAQVALSILLLAGAGLFLRTLQNLRTVDFGFHRDQLVSLSIDPGRAKRSRMEQEQLVRSVMTELETVPGIRSASIGGAGLLTGNGISMDVTVEGYTPAPGDEMRARAILAGPHFFETLGVPLLRGRGFVAADELPSPAEGESASPTVAVIGEAMARRFFPDTDPVGKYFTVDSEPKVRLEVIGVARDTRYSPDLRAEIPLQLYLPYFRSGIRMPTTFYLRADQPAAALTSGIRRVLDRVGPGLKIRSVSSMDEVIDRLLLRERVIAQLVSMFSLFALLLACLGLYGILSFRVAQRTREIGVRVALGATTGSVISLVIRQCLNLIGVGGVVGIAGALVATRFVASLLYGVTPADPVTFAAVLGVLMGIATFASWFPARRAARVDPMVALRAE